MKLERHRPGLDPQPIRHLGHRGCVGPVARDLELVHSHAGVRGGQPVEKLDFALAVRTADAPEQIDVDLGSGRGQRQKHKEYREGLAHQDCQ